MFRAPGCQSALEKPEVPHGKGGQLQIPVLIEKSGALAGFGKLEAGQRDMGREGTLLQGNAQGKQGCAYPGGEGFQARFPLHPDPQHPGVLPAGEASGSNKAETEFRRSNSGQCCCQPLQSGFVNFSQKSQSQVNLFERCPAAAGNVHPQPRKPLFEIFRDLYGNKQAHKSPCHDWLHFKTSINEESGTGEHLSEANYALQHAKKQVLQSAIVMSASTTGVTGGMKSGVVAPQAAISPVTP